MKEQTADQALKALKDPERPQADRIQAAKTLGKRGGPAHVDILLMIVAQNDFELQAAAAEALRQLDAARKVVVPRLQAKDAKARQRAATDLRRIVDPRTAGALLEAAKTEREPRVRSILFAALAELKAPEAMPALERALADPDRDVRCYTAAGLAAARHARALPALERAIEAELDGVTRFFLQDARRRLNA